MIVWLASYPRSGNTFTRIVLHHIYGAPTYTTAAAADDLSFDQGAGDLTGHRLLDPRFSIRTPRDIRNAYIQELEDSEEVYFIKTHAEARFPEYQNSRAIVLVRDARDVFVSLAHYYMNVLCTWPRFWKNRPRKRSKWLYKRWFSSLRPTLIFSVAKMIGMRKAIFRKQLGQLVREETWSRFQKSWLNRKDKRTAVITFTQLTENPILAMEEALRALDIPLHSVSEELPDFEELKKVHPKFFRKGTSGGWKDEWPESLHQPFNETHGEMMDALGFKIETATPAQ